MKLVLTYISTLIAASSSVFYGAHLLRNDSQYLAKLCLSHDKYGHKHFHPEYAALTSHI